MNKIFNCETIADAIDFKLKEVKEADISSEMKETAELILVQLEKMIIRPSEIPFEGRVSSVFITITNTFTWKDEEMDKLKLRKPGEILSFSFNASLLINQYILDGNLQNLDRKYEPKKLHYKQK